jgi:hypothetical protein
MGEAASALIRGDCEVQSIAASVANRPLGDGDLATV